MISFEFRLRPIEAIVPWGNPPSLHWFGLSDGWYWIKVGNFTFLQSTRPSDGLPYCDYQVVRLWEDLLDLLPAALAPLPTDVAETARRENWLAAVDSLEAEARATTDEGLLDLISEGLEFWRRRHLDLFYLAAPPRICMWRDGSTIRIIWRPPRDDRGHWVVAEGSTAVSVDAVVAAAGSFNDAFISQMKERVETIIRQKGLPGIAIDLVHLRVEQADRSTWLANVLATQSRRLGAERWDRTREMIDHASRRRLL